MAIIINDNIQHTNTSSITNDSNQCGCAGLQTYPRHYKTVGYQTSGYKQPNTSPQTIIDIKNLKKIDAMSI